MPNEGLVYEAPVGKLLLSRIGWPLRVMSELHSIEPIAQQDVPGSGSAGASYTGPRQIRCAL
jgi:hypothetical protein